MNITQGKTEHTATIIDSTVLAVFQKNKDDKSRNEYLSALDSGTKILIKWTIAGKKQHVEASSMKLVNDKEEEGSGRRSSKRRRWDWHPGAIAIGAVSVSDTIVSDGNAAAADVDTFRFVLLLLPLLTQ